MTFKNPNVSFSFAGPWLHFLNHPTEVILEGRGKLLNKYLYIVLSIFMHIIKNIGKQLLLLF